MAMLGKTIGGVGVWLGTVEQAGQATGLLFQASKGPKGMVTSPFFLVSVPSVNKGHSPLCCTIPTVSEMRIGCI